MTPCRRDPPLPNFHWEIGITHLPLGTPAVRLIIGATACLIPVGEAERIGRTLVETARIGAPA
jgi:hypothetical protein